MRPFPPMPRDRLLEEWLRPKTWAEWRRFCQEEPPLHFRVEQFRDNLRYFAAADLAYIDHGLIDRPSPETILALEYVAEHLAEDPEVLALLFICRDLARQQQSRWDAIVRALRCLKRIGVRNG